MLRAAHCPRRFVTSPESFRATINACQWLSNGTDGTWRRRSQARTGVVAPTAKAGNQTISQGHCVNYGGAVSRGAASRHRVLARTPVRHHLENRYFHSPCRFPTPGHRRGDVGMPACARVVPSIPGAGIYYACKHAYVDSRAGHYEALTYLLPAEKMLSPKKQFLGWKAGKDQVKLGGQAARRTQTIPNAISSNATGRFYRHNHE
jgi:hypothetical protein